MTGLLPTDVESRAKHMAEAWDYDSHADVLREALSLLDREKRLESLRDKIQKGLSSGDPTPLDVEDIKRRGRKRLAEMRANGENVPPS